MVKEFTADQIAEMHDHNEYFHGKTADFSKVMLYNEIKEELIELQKKCPDICKIDELPPGGCKRNAIICLDVDVISIFDKDAANILGDVIQKADRVIVGTDSSRVRFSFCVENVWEGEK